MVEVVCKSGGRVVRTATIHRGSHFVSRGLRSAGKKDKHTFDLRGGDSCQCSGLNNGTPQRKMKHKGR